MGDNPLGEDDDKDASPKRDAIFVFLEPYSLQASTQGLPACPAVGFCEDETQIVDPHIRVVAATAVSTYAEKTGETPKVYYYQHLTSEAEKTVKWSNDETFLQEMQAQQRTPGMADIYSFFFAQKTDALYSAYLDFAKSLGNQSWVNANTDVYVNSSWQWNNRWLVDSQFDALTSLWWEQKELRPAISGLLGALNTGHNYKVGLDVEDDYALWRNPTATKALLLEANVSYMSTSRVYKEYAAQMQQLTQDKGIMFFNAAGNDGPTVDSNIQEFEALGVGHTKAVQLASLYNMSLSSMYSFVVSDGTPQRGGLASCVDDYSTPVLQMPFAMHNTGIIYDLDPAAKLNLFGFATNGTSFASPEFMAEIAANNTLLNQQMGVDYNFAQVKSLLAAGTYTGLSQPDPEIKDCTEDTASMSLVLNFSASGFNAPENDGPLNTPSDEIRTPRNTAVHRPR